jgi:hypothetical protein
MAIKRALINPTPRDFNDNSEINQNSKVVQTTEEQMKFGMDNKKKKVRQFWGGLKLSIRRRNDFIEVSQFWKAFAFPLMITTSIFNILLLLIGGLFIQDTAPENIQLFYDSVAQTWPTEYKVDFTYVFILPIFLAIFLTLQYRFVKDIFRNDRRLAKMIAWLISFLNILLLIAIIQIYRLIN